MQSLLYVILVYLPRSSSISILSFWITTLCSYHEIKYLHVSLLINTKIYSVSVCDWAPNCSAFLYLQWNTRCLKHRTGPTMAQGSKQPLVSSCSISLVVSVIVIHCNIMAFSYRSLLWKDLVQHPDVCHTTLLVPLTNSV